MNDAETKELKTMDKRGESELGRVYIYLQSGK
jgi:hypothetical protein